MSNEAALSFGDPLSGKKKGACRILVAALLFPPLWLLPFAVSADWSALIDRLVADDLDEQAVRVLFARPEVNFEPQAMAGKLESLIRRQGGGAPGGPADRSTAVYPAFFKGRAIDRARAYVRENERLLSDVSRMYRVPREIVVSILLVETRLGESLGVKRAFNRLASMARCTDLGIIRPYLARNLITSGNEEFARTRCREKADWAYVELLALIDYAARNALDPLAIPGSTYGAIGLCQFMPSNTWSFGVDGDRDGRIDLFTKADALHSMANYLRGHGWKEGLDRRGQRRVILEYNRSQVYANTVLGVAKRLKGTARGRKDERASSQVEGAARAQDSP